MPQPFADEFRSIPMSSDLGDSLERARECAREQGHRAVTLEHLLLAFTEDPDASAVLQASTVDPVRLATDVSGYLGRLLDDMRAGPGAEPQTDPELLRVLHAAVQAAQQSRRRQIDGAIVLAAVVGDGKSPAAGLLKSHGLTFEEAIRALQKANAKANAQARSKQFARPASPIPPLTPPTASPPIESDAQPGKQSAGLEPLDAQEAQGMSQSVEDILAAARARIQERTAAIVGKSAEPRRAPQAQREPEPPQAEAAAPPPSPAASPPDESPTEPEENAPPAAPPMLAPSPSATPLPTSKQGAETPPSAAVQGALSARLPQPPPPHAQQPFAQRPLHPREGPPRPPLPHRGLPPQPGLPNRRPHAPWPNEEQHAQHARPPAANGVLADPPPAPVPRRPAQRTGGQPGHGPLVETIPRRMRLGVASAAQVRINRDRVDGLILLLMKGRGPAHRPDAFLTRALTVRLRAPDGGFWIEATSPETQWVEAGPGLPQDDHVSWRWTVTPQRRGRGRLVLVVTARTVGHDGLAAETSPPDRAIEVTVSGGRLRGLLRWSGFLAALILGAIVGRFGGEFWALGVAIFHEFVG